MRQLGNTELYKLHLSQGESNAIIAQVQKLSNNIAIISPQDIEEQLLSLKTASKRSFYALLSEALALYEQRGLIRLFNLGSTGSGRSQIPSYMPILMHGVKSKINPGIVDKVAFVNMYKIGNWAADESRYINLSAATDLYACLESGLITYKLSGQGMHKRAFDDKNVLEYLTKIYTNLFAQTLIKTKMTFGSQDFQSDAANFIIAKFFLLYVLMKQPTEFVDDLAYLTATKRSSLEALKSFEEASMIDYSSLTGFLATFGDAFFNDKVNLIEFENNWLKMYGEGMVFAIEYVPYLLHFLFASLHGATLGGLNRLSVGNRRNELLKLGLPKLYNALVSVIR